MADKQQLKIEQRNIGMLMMATLAAQAALSLAKVPSAMLLLPPAALAIAVMVLTLRSESMLRSLPRKRAFLAKSVFGIAACVTLGLLVVDEPRNAVLFWASGLFLIDLGFLVLGRLVGSMVGGDSAALG
jgi:hypothetical protein